MNENFQIATGFLEDGANLGQGKLARQRDAIEAGLLRKTNASGIGDAHLRTGVKFDLRRDFAGKASDAVILDDHRVGSGFSDGGDGLGRLGDFVLEDQRVESDVASYA